MNSLVKRLSILSLLLILFCIGSVLAQPPVEGGDPGGGEDPDVPITGIEWLLLAGGALGAKKIHDYRKGKE